jgi:hypothetical protein
MHDGAGEIVKTEHKQGPQQTGGWKQTSMIWANQHASAMRNHQSYPSYDPADSDLRRHDQRYKNDDCPAQNANIDA